MTRCRRPVDDTYDSDVSFSLEDADELLYIVEDQNDNSTKPTDLEGLGTDDNELFNINED